jgi:hypothetical protein
MSPKADAHEILIKYAEHLGQEQVGRKSQALLLYTSTGKWNRCDQSSPLVGHCTEAVKRQIGEVINFATQQNFQSSMEIVR